MIILVEGPDGCGKTNITAALSEHYKIPSFKVTTETSNWENNSFKNSIPFDILLPQFVKQTGLSFISDRSYVSEIVYARTYGRNTDWPGLWQADFEWSRQNAIILLLLRRDYSDVEDELVDSRDMNTIHDEYVNFSGETGCTVIEMYVDDYSNDIKEQLPVLIDQIEWAK